MRFRDSLNAKVIVALSATFLFSGLAFGILYHRFEHQGIEALMLSQSKTLFRQIQLTRHWNSNYEGVYVKRKKGMEVNPFLYQVGPAEGLQAEIRPEITDLEGNTYILKNPALMARELSELSSARSDIRFHLTSLKPINPDNNPDDFERLALTRFEEGVEEWSGIDEERQRFRYMAPLKVERSCLKCHGFQGYKIGDIRGGLAIDLPMDSALETIRSGRTLVIAGGIAAVLSVLLVLWLLLRRLILQPIRQMESFAEHIGSPDTMPFELPERNDELGRFARVLAAVDKEIRSQQQTLMDEAERLDTEHRRDRLTMLHNRRHLYLNGERAVSLARREGFEITILTLDIDGMKEINKRFGREAGDRLLLETAQTMKNHSRLYDMLARYGDDDFAVIIQHCSKEQAHEIAERFQRDVGALRIEHDGEYVQATCSIGICTSRVKDIEQMVIAANEALLKAKSSGSNQIAHSA